MTSITRRLNWLTLKFNLYGCILKLFVLSFLKITNRLILEKCEERIKIVSLWALDHFKLFSHYLCQGFDHGRPQGGGGAHWSVLPKKQTNENSWNHQDGIMVFITSNHPKGQGSNPAQGQIFIPIFFPFCIVNRLSWWTGWRV